MTRLRDTVPAADDTIYETALWLTMSRKFCAAAESESDHAIDRRLLLEWPWSLAVAARSVRSLPRNLWQWSSLDYCQRAEDLSRGR